MFADRWDAIDDLDYQNAVARFQGTPLPNGEEEYAYFRDNKINYNVNDYIWQNPWNTKHSLSVNGGTDKVKYYVMGSFLAEEGSYVSLENKKFSFTFEPFCRFDQVYNHECELGCESIER